MKKILVQKGTKRKTPSLALWKVNFTKVNLRLIKRLKLIVSRFPERSRSEILYSVLSGENNRGLSNNDYDGSKNVYKTMNSRPFKLQRVYLDPLYLSNAGHFR